MGRQKGETKGGGQFSKVPTVVGKVILSEKTFKESMAQFSTSTLNRGEHEVGK